MGLVFHYYIKIFPGQGLDGNLSRYIIFFSLGLNAQVIKILRHKAAQFNVTHHLAADIMN